MDGKAAEAVTNISLGTLTISADTTVAEFSNAVVQHNKFFEYGDQITYFLVSQEVDEVNGTPMADVDACCIVLDKNRDAKLLSLVDPRGFASRDNTIQTGRPESQIDAHSTGHNAHSIGICYEGGLPGATPSDPSHLPIIPSWLEASI